MKRVNQVKRNKVGFRQKKRNPISKAVGKIFKKFHGVYLSYRRVRHQFNKDNRPTRIANGFFKFQSFTLEGAIDRFSTLEQFTSGRDATKKKIFAHLKESVKRLTREPKDPLKVSQTHKKIQTTLDDIEQGLEILAKTPHAAIKSALQKAKKALTPLHKKLTILTKAQEQLAKTKKKIDEVQINYVEEAKKYHKENLQKIHDDIQEIEKEIKGTKSTFVKNGLQRVIKKYHKCTQKVIADSNFHFTMGLYDALRKNPFALERLRKDMKEPVDLEKISQRFQIPVNIERLKLCHTMLMAKEVEAFVKNPISKQEGLKLQQQLTLYQPQDISTWGTLAKDLNAALAKLVEKEDAAIIAELKKKGLNLGEILQKFELNPTKGRRRRIEVERHRIAYLQVIGEKLNDSLDLLEILSLAESAQAQLPHVRDTFGLEQKFRELLPKAVKKDVKDALGLERTFKVLQAYTRVKNGPFGKKLESLFQIYQKVASKDLTTILEKIEGKATKNDGMRNRVVTLGDPVALDAMRSDLESLMKIRDQLLKFSYQAKGIKGDFESKIHELQEKVSATIDKAENSYRYELQLALRTHSVPDLQSLTKQNQIILNTLEWNKTAPGKKRLSFQPQHSPYLEQGMQTIRTADAKLRKLERQGASKKKIQKKAAILHRAIETFQKARFLGFPKTAQPNKHEKVIFAFDQKCREELATIEKYVTKTLSRSYDTSKNTHHQLAQQLSFTELKEQIEKVGIETLFLYQKAYLSKLHTSVKDLSLDEIDDVVETMNHIRFAKSFAEPKALPKMPLDRILKAFNEEVKDFVAKKSNESSMYEQILTGRKQLAKFSEYKTLAKRIKAGLNKMETAYTGHLKKSMKFDEKKNLLEVIRQNQIVALAHKWNQKAPDASRILINMKSFLNQPLINTIRSSYKELQNLERAVEKNAFDSGVNIPKLRDKIRSLGSSVLEALKTLKEAQTISGNTTRDELDRHLVGFFETAHKKELNDIDRRVKSLLRHTPKSSSKQEG